MAKGLARDTRVRWALEEVGQPYEVRLVSSSAMKESAPLAFSAGDLMMVSVLLRLRSTGILDEFSNLAAYVARGDAEEAANFYAKIFPDSSVDAVHLALGDYPSGQEGEVITVQFTVMGIPHTR